MNNPTMKTPYLLASLLLLGLMTGSSLRAAEPAMVDQVSVKEGALLAVTGDKRFTPTNTVALPLEIKVMTNLTFTVADGAPRKLAEGQKLMKNGTLVSPDGSITPVFDHVTVRGGRPVVVKDGKASPVNGTFKLQSGAVVSADGWHTAANGQRTRLLDGRVIKLSGETFAASDSATLIDGKVVVHKDGAKYTVQPGRTLMMSDGSKIFGDGRVIRRDGKTEQLQAGEVTRFEGVRQRGL